MNTRERPQADPAAVLKGLAEAGAHADAGRTDQAAQIYRRLERAFPQDIRAPYSLAVIDLGQGRLARARRRLEAVTALAPDHMPAQHNLGAARQQLGDWPGAAKAYQAAVALAPDAIEPRQALAAALTVLGRTAAALEHYRVLAEVPAARWAALTRMALIDAGAIDEAMLADMRSAAADLRLDPELRTGLLFGLGEALERRGAYDQAFAAFAEGNRLKRGSLRPSAPEAARAHAAAADHVRSRFTAAFIAANDGKGSRSAAPIFVVGFPRSGSTLIEQILASHPAVQGLGETGVLPRLLERGYPAVGDISATWLRDLAAAYLQAARDRGWDGKSRFVDKTLENYLHVGMIHLAFPRAVVLHAQRDPLDVGVSCFRQLFNSGNETLYDLADIGAEFGRHRSLMAHWLEVLPGRVADISHEALVADPETEIRALLTAAGVSWDPAVMRFFERDGVVRTASAAQVRRPIFSDSVARWRRYEAHLAPLRAALGA
jgi:tetratricopeptide (TPR) repeat protein